MSNLKIHFLRHGQTELSKQNLFCGSGMNPSLTEHGFQMAESFSKHYQSTSWQAIYASPLLRAVQTATCLSEKINIELTIRDGLQEINYGEWEGKSVEEVEKNFHLAHAQWKQDPAAYAPTQGENAHQIKHRAIQVIQEIQSAYPQGNVLVVSHKATIRVALCALLGIDISQFRFRLDCPVCSLSVVEFTHTGPMLRLFADRSHLTKELRELPGT